MLYANAGQAQDNATFADSILSVPDLVDTAQTQLSRGAYPAIALITMEIAVRSILGATYVYKADAAAAYQQGVSEARLILQARIFEYAAAENKAIYMSRCQSLNSLDQSSDHQRNATSSRQASKNWM